MSYKLCILLVINAFTVSVGRHPVRFIILARQRGGSHFLRNLLTTTLEFSHCDTVASGPKSHKSEDRCTPDVYVASQEKIRKKDLQSRCRKKTDWMKCVDNAFLEQTKNKKSFKSRAIGFTLHHHQIWCYEHIEFADCMHEFGQWAKKEKIRIVHLVRETVLMMISSNYLAGLLPDHDSVTSSSSTAAEAHSFAVKHKMPLTEAMLNEIDSIENEISIVDQELKKVLSEEYYHYVRYEDLIDIRIREAKLAEIFHFIPYGKTMKTIAIRAQFENLNSLELHPATCASRIDNWQLAQHLLKNSTRQACVSLDEILSYSTHLEQARFLIVARQRGGSHFLRALLTTPDDSQCHVAAKEKVRRYDLDPGQRCGNKTAWIQCVDHAFDELNSQYRMTRAIGFTLHHHQIWCQRSGKNALMSFEECMHHLGEWAQNRSIRVIHLVRETVLMMVSSEYLSKVLPVHTSITTNETVAVQQHDFALHNQMPISKTTRYEIERAEEEFDTVRKVLSKYLQHNYRYITYESLIDHRVRFATLRDAFHFIGIEDVDEKFITSQFEDQKFLALHPSTCKSRVHNWKKNNAKLHESTRKACHKLDQILDANRKSNQVLK